MLRANINDLIAFSMVAKEQSFTPALRQSWAFRSRPSATLFAVWKSVWAFAC
ncbi:hypothetical protein ACVWVS_000241 [Ewingella americana]